MSYEEVRLQDDSGVEGEFSGLRGVQFLGSAMPDLGSRYISHNIRCRPEFSIVSVELNGEDSVIAPAGMMSWMDSDIQINTGCLGGPLAGCLRSCSGTPCCLNKFSGSGRVTFGQRDPGNSLAFAVDSQTSWILTQGAFIAGSPELLVSGAFPGIAACLCSGELGSGFLLTKISSQVPAMFFAGGHGDIIRHEVREGETIFVDNGLFFAASSKTNIGITILGDIKTFCFGGEGFVMKFVGPCVVYTQTRDPMELYKRELARQAAQNGGSNGSSSQ